MKSIIVFMLLLLSTGWAKADCWKFAAKKSGVEVRLLKSIAQVESGMDPSVVGKNNNGSRDFGLMQINSTHLAWLGKNGISESMLVKDPCVSVLVGAAILKNMVNIYGYGWEAVGAYNAGAGKNRHSLRMKYARKVWVIYRQPARDNIPIPLNNSHRNIALLR
ncbi:transglycosylase SLT domain-containing protein [Cedecea davisae]|uniref:transglycosylase SLT domain-containing protein n=1 Tax=Cedecea davisae TaxID=158484 RepID=UPI002431556A|nr:transglycosylase SLT domain-containing protein [Cedecea davisae]